MMVRLSASKLIFVTIFSGILTIAGCGSSEKNRIPSLDSIIKKWIPDGREALCTITVERLKSGTLVVRGETNIQNLKNESLELLKNSGFNVTDSIIVLPDTSRNKYLGIATLSVINLRKQPDHASELVSQAIMGTPVIVLKNVDSWVLVQTPDKYISWTEESSVRLMDKEEFKDWRSAEKIIYFQYAGRIYSSPDESAIAGDIVSGCILKKAGKSGNHTKVEFPDGREGYLRNNEITDFDAWKEKQEITGDDICAVASEFMGSPYLWGGTSSKAVDCSGFVKSVYFMNGIILARDASLQASHGKSIDISGGYDQLIKGDLLFFGWKDDSVTHVVHVAIYKGDNEFIHSSGRVMISSLDPASELYDPDRKNSLLSARRILGAENDNGIVRVSRHELY